MSDVAQPVAAAAEAPPVAETAPPTTPGLQKPNWKDERKAARRRREQMIPTWKDNVQFRLGKPFRSEPTADTVNVPVDWSRTKNKVSQLFFQMPEVNLQARRPEYADATAVFAAALNFELQNEIKIHVTMDECLQDVVNAAGHMAAILGYDVTTEPVEVPTVDTSMYTPEQLQAIADPTTGQVPTKTVQRPVYQCYYARRISPAQLLVPAEFVGSDFQRARWLGHDDRIPLAEALRIAWVDASYEAEHKDKLETVNDTAINADDKNQAGKFVKYSRIFYRRYDVDPTCKDPREIWQVILVDGKDDPVKDEPLPWQKYVPETRGWVGLTTFPIKIATLTTVSDTAFPPSDTEIGRPQVKELIESRSQMVRQRKNSQPMRWWDVNAVDEDVAEAIRQGTWQDMIPTNGPGGNAIGEVARASYPSENFEFNTIIAKDLDEAWSMGANQQGFESSGDTSATEANIVAQNANTRLEYEQVRALRFYLEIAEGIGSLMQVFETDERYVQLVGPDAVPQMQAWDKTKIAGEFVYDAKPDSSRKVDINQKRAQSLNLYKMMRRDPLINPQALVSEVLEDHGMTPSKIMVPPAPPPVKPAALRFSYAGADLTNPLVVALVQKNMDNPVTPQDIQAAQQIMQAAGIPSVPPQTLPLPVPGKDGQPPSPDQVATAGGAQPQMGGPQAPHPGPPEQVTPLNQRYERNPNQPAVEGAAA